MALHRIQSLGGPCGQSLPHEARARVQGIRSPNGSDTLPLASSLRAGTFKGFELKANQWRGNSRSAGTFPARTRKPAEPLDANGSYYGSVRSCLNPSSIRNDSIDPDCSSGVTPARWVFSPP